MKIDILGKKEDSIKMRQVANMFQRVSDLVNQKIEINLTHDFSAFVGHSFNPAKTPIIFINGQIEFAGIAPDFKLIQSKIIQIRDKGSDIF